MRWTRLLAGIAVVATLGAGCDNTTTTVAPEKLAPPLGLYSVTGDGSVTLHWQASNYGESRQGFEIYQWAGSWSGTEAPETIPTTQFGTTPVVSYVTATSAGSFSKTVTGLTNGTTYSFLVVAYKSDGDELSRPSNIVIDTPRRESLATITLINGSGQLRYLDVAGDPPAATASFSAGVDIMCQSFNAGAGDRSGMVGQNNAQIQDLGYVSSWDEIDTAPAGAGSYPDATHSVEVLDGHVYAIFTGDNHYAKIYIVELNTGNFGFVCNVAYQPQTGNNELDARVPVN